MIPKDTTKELAPIKARTNKMQAVVNSLIIKNEKDLAEVAKIRAGIKEVKKQIKDKKEEITTPLNTALKNVRALFAPLEASCEEATEVLDQKYIAYNRQIEEARRTEEAKLAARVEKGTLKMETAVKKIEAIAEAPKHIATDKGSMTITKRKNFKVVDINKLPIQYHLANESEIRRAMYAGTQLPGVEYWEDEIVSGR